MIEKTIRNHLSKKLDIPVKYEYPAKPPKRFIVIERTGGSEENHIFYSTFAIQSIDETLIQAAQLNEKVMNAMDEIILCDDISSVKLNTYYNFTDSGTNRYRYQAVYDIVHY